MPWSTPTLATVRATNRDYITGRLGVPLIPNDVPRALADANAGNAHLNLQYLDWLALQLLPDTAEQQFLEKWANLYLVNADGSKGRKVATYAAGTVTLVATVSGSVLPAGSFLTALSGSQTLTFQTTAATAINLTPTNVPTRALNAGAAANLAAGSVLSLALSVPGIDVSSATVVALAGGADAETDPELRVRVLFRIQNPPMGGAADDYVGWALACPGVTRAWLSPQELGPGTVTLRFMMDKLRGTANPMTDGFPLAADLAAVKAYVDTKRPVTVLDFFVCAPIPQPVSCTITNLYGNTAAAKAAIGTSVAAAIAQRARPARAVNGQATSAQTIYAAWVSDAILSAPGVKRFDLAMADAVMPNKGSMAVIGSIFYG